MPRPRRRLLNFREMGGISGGAKKTLFSPLPPLFDCDSGCFSFPAPYVPESLFCPSIPLLRLFPVPPPPPLAAEGQEILEDGRGGGVMRTTTSLQIGNNRKVSCRQKKVEISSAGRLLCKAIMSPFSQIPPP